MQPWPIYACGPYPPRLIGTPHSLPSNGLGASGAPKAPVGALQRGAGAMAPLVRPLVQEAPIGG
eukprot:5424451-Alexandrium_andersonii.AAC.1